MLQTSDIAFRVNPYTRWVYDHPERLLPEPTPEALRQRRARHPSPHLLVELGSGSGNFLLHLAQGHPTHHVVGFELRFKRLVKSARKMEKRELENVWVLREEAGRFVDYFPPDSIDRLFINFPDPWPKASQRAKRMVSPTLLEGIGRTLKPGGTFHLKTDHSGYFLHVLSLVQSRADLRLRAMSNDLHRHWPQGRGPAESEFERLFVSLRKPVFYLVLEKRLEGG